MLIDKRFIGSIFEKQKQSKGFIASPTQTPPCWIADIYNSPCCAGAGGETLPRTCKLTTSYRAEQRLPIQQAQRWWCWSLSEGGKKSGNASATGIENGPGHLYSIALNLDHILFAGRFHVYLTDFKAIPNKLLRARRQKESVLKPKQSS